MYCGSWKIDDTLTFTVNTHDPSTGEETDADAAPTYRVYEDETGTPILTGTMALLDDANTVGHYSEQITLSAANGFEKGKSYNVRIRGVVGGVAGATTRAFQIEAEVDSNTVSGTVPTVTNLTNAPTAGDFTATMKTSIGTAVAASAVASVTGNVGGNVAGSVGSVTAAITLPTIPNNWITAAGINADAITAAKVAADVHQETIELAFTYDATATYGTANAGSLVAQIADNAGGSALTTDAIAEAMFTYNATADYSTADAGSVVKQIADNAGGSALTEEGIADAVWDELQSGHVGAGTFGEIATEIASILADTGTDGVLVSNGTGTGQLSLVSGTVLLRAATEAQIDAIEADTNELQTDDYPARFTGIEGATFNTSTDSLEALRNRGDAAWVTATGFSTHSATDVWAAGTRTLTAGTNIVLVKGTGVTGFTDLSAADVRTAVGLASANLDTQLGDLPTGAELATALAAADDAILAAIAALNNLSAAQVNAEVVDALATDTYAEPTGVPSATASLAAKVGRLYKALMRGVEVTASAKTFLNAAGADEWKKDLADDGTVYSEGSAEAP